MRAVLWIIIGLTALPSAALAQTDEIQVYDAEIEPPGIFNLMVHSNFTPAGRTVPDFPGAIIADHSFNGTAEWAYGVTPWMEQGLYLPVYTIYSMNHATTINGFKIRELFVRPHAHDHTFFYGINYEFSVNALYWEDRRISSEIRPIVGLHLHPWDFIYNPIVDTDFTGGFGNLQYNPAGRIAYNLNDRWAFAAEEYDSFGPLRRFVPYRPAVSRNLGRHGSLQQQVSRPRGRSRHWVWFDSRLRQNNAQVDAVTQPECARLATLSLRVRG